MTKRATECERNRIILCEAVQGVRRLPTPLELPFNLAAGYCPGRRIRPFKFSDA